MIRLNYSLILGFFLGLHLLGCSEKDSPTVLCMDGRNGVLLMASRSRLLVNGVGKDSSVKFALNSVPWRGFPSRIRVGSNNDDFLIVYMVPSSASQTGKFHQQGKTCLLGRFRVDFERKKIIDFQILQDHIYDIGIPKNDRLLHVTTIDEPTAREDCGFASQLQESTLETVEEKEKIQRMASVRTGEELCNNSSIVLFSSKGLPVEFDFRGTIRGLIESDKQLQATKATLEWPHDSNFVRSDTGVLQNHGIAFDFSDDQSTVGVVIFGNQTMRLGIWSTVDHRLIFEKQVKIATDITSGSKEVRMGCLNIDSSRFVFSCQTTLFLYDMIRGSGQTIESDNVDRYSQLHLLSASENANGKIVKFVLLPMDSQSFRTVEIP